MRKIAAVVALLTVWGCGKVQAGSTLPRQTQEVDGRTIYGVLPTGPTDRAVLRALPTVATYRWGYPSAHFSGVSAEDDSASVSFAAHELRRYSSEVLRLNGWREAGEGEAAEFELAVMRVERTAEWKERRQDPRVRGPDPNSCRNKPAAQRANCIEPMPREAPTVLITVRGTEVRHAFAIVRLRDGATAWWVSPQQSEIQIATLRLLQAGIAESPAPAP